MIGRMDGDDALKARWGRLLDRMGAAGRDWRKSLAARQTGTAAGTLDLHALKRRIKDLRAARAAGHWSFRPEALRSLLAIYVRLRTGRALRPMQDRVDH